MNKKDLINKLKEKFPESNLFELFEIIDRKDFLPGVNNISAYEDSPIPIGDFQHSLEPSAVIEIINMLNLEQNQEILEIGTGSGYLTACVYKKINPGNIISVERIKRLCSLAKNNLEKKFPNAIEKKKIRIFWENGIQSPQHFVTGNFDRIYFTCKINNAFKIEPFIDLLKENGIIVFYQDGKLKSFAKGGRGKPFLLEEKEVKYSFDEIKSNKI